MAATSGGMHSTFFVRPLGWQPLTLPADFNPQSECVFCSECDAYLDGEELLLLRAAPDEGGAEPRLLPLGLPAAVR